MVLWQPIASRKKGPESPPIDFLEHGAYYYPGLVGCVTLG